MIGKITKMVHFFIEEFIDENSICIDATVGNGNDTLFLSERCKFVYGFDIQESAIEETRKKLKKDNFQLFLCGHEHMDGCIMDFVDLIIFNLGYLPNADKTIITSASTTVEALKKSLKLLNKGGRIIVTSYYGHEGGLEEKNAIEEFFSNLDDSMYSIVKYNIINRKKQSPIIYMLEFSENS